MNRHVSRWLLLSTAMFLGLFSQQLFAQGESETRVMPYVLPPGGGEQPTLGFMGTMIPDYGLRVNSVVPGSPASKAGLEGGDVLWRVDGRRILNITDYREALQHAVQYHGGLAALKVRNVRYDWGASPLEFVTVTVRVSGSPQIMAYQAGEIADPDSIEAGGHESGGAGHGHAYQPPFPEDESSSHASGDGY